MVQSGPKGRIVQILNPTLFDILYVRVPVIFKLRQVNNLHVAFDATGIMFRSACLSSAASGSHGLLSARR